MQLGLRGDVLARYSRDWILEIEDISAFVEEQREHVRAKAYDRLVVPKEDIYSVDDPEVARRLGLTID